MIALFVQVLRVIDMPEEDYFLRISEKPFYLYSFMLYVLFQIQNIIQKRKAPKTKNADEPTVKASKY